MKSLVLASSNKGKVKEFNELLSGWSCNIIPQTDLGVLGCDEPFGTFLENAIHKARHASRQTGLPALADDSGLCVLALGGAPGVLSARYAAQFSDSEGQTLTDDNDANNNRCLLQQLQSLTSIADRAAYFYCVLVGLAHTDDPCPLVAQGVWHGHIALSMSGAGGFGYDPLFVPLGHSVTAAELSAAEKNRLSHRAQALKSFQQLWEMGWAQSFGFYPNG